MDLTKWQVLVSNLSMKDLQREILSQVAAGTMTAEEGAARLEALESNPPPTPSPSPASPAPGQVRIVSRFGNTEVIGDASVSYAVADGPHRVRQDGDTMVFEQSVFTDDSFEFIRRAGRPNAFGEKLTVRMNPMLPLAAKVQAGNIRIDGIHGRLTAEAQAGNCTVTDFRGPISLTAIAGNVEASGQLDSGASSIRCDMGEVHLVLARSSSVRISARSTLGEVALDGEGISSSGNEAKLGSGTGTLDIKCTMGSVRVAVK
jgi:hypothetical protein